MFRKGTCQERQTFLRKRSSEVQVSADSSSVKSRKTIAHSARLLFYRGNQDNSSGLYQRP